MRLYQLLPAYPGQEKSAAIICKCGKWTPLKDAMADLDAPFGTFYCPDCLGSASIRAAIKTAIEKC